MNKTIAQAINPKRKLTMLAASALLASTMLIGHHAVASENEVNLPEEWVQAFQEKNLKVQRTFKAEPGVTGIIIDHEPGNQIIYLLNESNALIEGPLITVDGTSLTEQHVMEQYLGKRLHAALELLETRTDLWVLNGSSDADWVIYSFDDMNCPFCARQFQSLKPLIESGQLQVRHLLVGILGPDSHSLAEAIINSDNPSEALLTYQNQFGQPGAKEALLEAGGEISPASASIIEENMRLARVLGANSTPTTLLPPTEAGGYPKVLQGAQEAAQIEAHFTGQE